MSDDTLTIVGYHGTLMDRARVIEENGFKQSNKIFEWLGYGVYFFDSFDNAKKWAHQEFRRTKGRRSPPVVIIVDINLEPHSLLDLDLQCVMDNFKELESMCLTMFNNSENGAPRFKDERECRCFWCNCYMAAHPELKVIAFSFPLKTFDYFGFPEKKRQLCVVDNGCICKSTLKVEAIS